ncbi:MAG: type VI secretion system baseplate subunit TssG [Acidobacteria bacterium]|nr:type VI secretion system baseplate subunit TssG [Acidobacteriota bacterium]
MAAPSGPVDTALAERRLEQRLFQEPYVFQFFQAVRLLEKMARGSRPVGHEGPPASEPVRFSAHPSLAFPASQLQALLPAQGGAPPRLVVNFMGLTGPLGVLPFYYTQAVIERTRARDTALRDFLDIFNHRILSLFYQAWEKYRVAVQYERGSHDRFSHYLLDVIGLGTRGLRKRQAVADDALIYYAGLLGQRPRSALALRQLLEDYFDVPVAVEQFAGAWFPIERSNQCWLEERRDDSERLGWGVVVGDEVFDNQSRARVRLGPLSLEQYRDFLPTGTAYRPLRALLRFFSDEVDFEVQLVLKREEVPPCELGAEGGQAPVLGWVTWMKTVSMARDPGDTVLRISYGGSDERESEIPDRQAE